MNNDIYIIGFSASSLALGALGMWLFMQAKLKETNALAQGELKAVKSSLEERLQAKETHINELKVFSEDLKKSYSQLNTDLSNSASKVAELTALLGKEKQISVEKITLLQDAEKKLLDVFKSLSADALKDNNQQFLDLAKASLEKFQDSARNDLETRQKSIDELVKPLKDSLSSVDNKISEIEKSRIEAYTSLTTQVKSLAETQTNLKQETHNLVSALKAPVVRGRWGELQLKRVVEMAGMLNYCDFTEQQHTVDKESGNILRPDMIIRLPNNKIIVVDSKVPLQAYLDSLETNDPNQAKQCLQNHARQIREHLSQLGKKAYWEQFDNTPDFVVMFLPGETFYNAALEQDPQLLEIGIEQKVLIATPTSLIGLLRAVAFGWKQEKLAENAQQISNLGKALYERIRILADHFGDLKKGIEKTVDAFNKASSSLESRVLVTTRRFKELGATDNKEIALVETIDMTPKMLQSPELVSDSGLSERVDSHKLNS
jgi:DNA recombination protein RmuC